jgi:hypothetical protein
VFRFCFSFLEGRARVHLVRRPLIGLLYQSREIDDECGTVGGIKIGRRNRSIGENQLQCHIVYHKHHTIWPGLEPGQPRLEAGDLPPELWHGYLRC